MPKCDTKIEINEEFEKALQMLEGEFQSLFITGKAGTGKSTLLEYFRQRTKKNVAVLAPTGVAALNVNGQTIHSFFLIPPNITPNKVLDHKLPKKRKNLIKKLDMIIIDEASMLRADLLDCIDVSLRHYRGQENEPFGGVKMVFIGDLYQLPPVVASAHERDFFSNHYGSPYFFSAKCLEHFQMNFLELEKIYRQKDDGFIALLNKIRDNSVDAEDIEALNTRHDPHFDDEVMRDFVITLTTTNASADDKNMRELARLGTAKESFFGEIDGDFKKKNLPTAMELDIKVGAQVMMLSNDPMGRWVNGSIGKVIGVEFDDIVGEDLLIVDINGEKSVEIKKHTWKIHKYFYNEETNQLDTEVVGSFTQFPLRLAWAVTIHKSQGKTFDNVIIDIGRGTFAHGQIYVALSRCTSFEGIILKKRVEKRHILMDRKVDDFFNRMRYHQPLSGGEVPVQENTPVERHLW
ncbi:AAA family ATPase [Candidatus Peregrinibacteria bacterium]|nr:AAA family ATPase [Candidatus Peregrinibacteria bacterium]MBT7736939.1 AAA family ATPase [Candidatus Peregrinibacteria bacterium]